MWVFIAALLIIGKNCKQPRLGVLQQVNGYTNYDTHIYYAIHSATKRNELSRRATTWMNLQGGMSSDTKWTPKGYTLYGYIYITFLKWHNFRIGKQIRGCQGLWMGTEGELDAVMKGQHKACLWWNCLVLDMAADIPIYTW